MVPRDHRLSSVRKSLAGLLFFYLIPIGTVYFFRKEICLLLNATIWHIQIVCAVLAVAGYEIACRFFKIGNDRPVFLGLSIGFGVSVVLVAGTFILPFALHENMLNATRLTIGRVERVVALAMFAAAIEEIFFRGYLKDVLDLFFPKRICCLLLGALFMLLHTQEPLLMSIPKANYFLAGVLLTLVCYLPGGSVIAALSLHFFFDCAAFVMYGMPGTKFKGISSDQSYIDLVTATITLVAATVSAALYVKLSAKAGSK